MTHKSLDFSVSLVIAQNVRRRLHKGNLTEKMNGVTAYRKLVQCFMFTNYLHSSVNPWLCFRYFDHNRQCDAKSVSQLNALRKVKLLEIILKYTNHCEVEADLSDFLQYFRAIDLISMKLKKLNSPNSQNNYLLHGLIRTWFRGFAVMPVYVYTVINYPTSMTSIYGLWWELILWPK